LLHDEGALDRALFPIARRARRGTIIVLLSDLLDLPPATLDRFAALATGGRILIAVQVLDPDELTFPYEGTVLLRALEGHAVVETDADAMRHPYIAALNAVGSTWSSRLTSHGGSPFLTSPGGRARDRGAPVSRAVAGA